MKKLSAIFMACMVVFAVTECKAFDLVTHCTAQQKLSDDAFFETFPYEDYLATALVDPLPQLLRDRDILQASGRNEVADPLLFGATDYYLKATPIDVTDLHVLKAQLRLAKQFLEFHSPTDSSLNFLTQSIGDRFFSSAAYRIEEGYANGLVNKDAKVFGEVFELLRSSHYAPNIPASNSEKLVTHVKNGDWAYIWDRFKTRYLKDTILAISLAMNLLFLSGPLLRRLKKRFFGARQQFHSPASSKNQL